MNEITHFHGVLPPRGNPPADRRGPEPKAPYGLPAPTEPDGLILHALRPLQEQLDDSLARGDRKRALQIAYGALSRVADTLAAYRGDTLRPGQTRIHALLIELDELPLESRPDGTLAEHGTTVHVSYCNWAVERAEADAMARALTAHLQTVWPGAWVVISP